MGIVYTLLLLGIKDVDFFSAKDYNEVDVVLATVDNAKYVMNYWPNSVVNTELSDFSNIKSFYWQYLIYHSVLNVG